MSRQGLVVITAATYANFIIGVMAQYQQNVALFGIFMILNEILGVSVFLFHCGGNELVRVKMEKVSGKLA